MGRRAGAGRADRDQGHGVGLLAFAAARAATSTDGWLLAVLLALGALGDMVLEVGFEAGVVAFAAGHIASILLFRRNRRPAPTVTQRAAAGALPLFGAIMPMALLGDRAPQIGALTAYSVLLTLMAATARLGSFPRYRTGLGAVLFVASDALIAARMGPLAGGARLGPAIWLLYYLGQLLIFIGVDSQLRTRRCDR